MSADGDWAITMNTPMGEQKATLTLKTSGADLDPGPCVPVALNACVPGTTGPAFSGDPCAWPNITS